LAGPHDGSAATKEEAVIMSNDADPVHVLHPEESWEFLRGHEFGRLAYHLAGEVHLVPINYTVDGKRLLFMTSEGNKLLGVTMNTDVAFEVDEVEDEHATSVVVRGRAHQLEGQERHVVERLPLRPWVDYPKSAVVAIRVDEVTGRRFDLTRPWLHDRAEPTTP
jgi:nitroimidazol reductase NimA-like FMN-containing flavoprotein (pyridoxamine 5'-phosphate oxidase superfamily)